MIVIVEGADLVGKSTVVDRLSAERGVPIVKLRWDLLGDPMVETTAMAKATLALLEALAPDVIFDRSFLSWWLYGPVLRHAARRAAAGVAGPKSQFLSAAR